MSNSFPARSTTSTALTPLDETQDAAMMSPAGEDGYQLALALAEAADDRKGGDIVLLKVSEVSYLADYFVIVTGFSNTQVRAIANSMLETAETDLQRVPLRVEGLAEASWVLLDYGDVIVHVFQPKERSFYGLEAFWGHAEPLPFPPVSA